MKRFIAVALLTGAGLAAQAQSVESEVVGSGGSESSNSEITLSWTVGEAVVTTERNSDVTLTQGFHQPTYVFVSIEEEPVVDFSIYPNPTQGEVRVQLAEGAAAHYNLQLIDLNGRVMSQTRLTATDNSALIDLSALPTGMYVLRALNADGTQVNVYKIQKTR